MILKSKSKCCCKLKTIALLELNGPYALIDNAIAKTFRYLG
jgi:hypothetical protein